MGNSLPFYYFWHKHHCSAIFSVINVENDKSIIITNYYLRMSALFLTSIRNQGTTFLSTFEDAAKNHDDFTNLFNLARYWVESCVLTVDPAILACRDVPLLQSYGTFLSIEYSRRFQSDAHSVFINLLKTDCTYDCKVQFISELLINFARPPVAF